MRYCDYESSGIHSRLKVIIAKSGGYDVDASARLLMKEYKLNNYEVAYEMAKNEKIRDEIDAVGIDSIVDLTIKSIRLQKIKLRTLFGIFDRKGFMK